MNMDKIEQLQKMIDESNNIVVFSGASVYSFLGYFYIKNRNKYKLASKFIITKEE